MTIELRDSVNARLREAVRVSYAQGAAARLEATLDQMHAADLAEAMRDLRPAECLAIFAWLDNERAATVLSELEPDLVRYVLENAPPGRITDLLDRLPMDDAAAVVAEASPEHSETLLADLASRAPADAREVRELLSYDDGTAGRLMTDRYLGVLPNATVQQALIAVRVASKEVETLTDVYVVDTLRHDRQLLGVMSLRELVAAHPLARVADIMNRRPVTAVVDDEQAEVARLISKYDLHALPVLDRQGDFVGIVTVDDVIDVLVEEFNQDYLKLVGSHAEEMERRSPLQVARLRLPWLLGTMVIEMVAAVVIAHYTGVLQMVPLLASFMPVISAISGNVGLQAAAIVVRGLDTGHVSVDNWWRAVRKELATSMLMALACGLVLGTLAVGWSGKLSFGIVIGGAMSCSMLTAGLLGTVVPMLSKRLGFDPAASAGPFETAFQDVVGFGVFLWLASLMLHWLR